MGVTGRVAAAADLAVSGGRRVGATAGDDLGGATPRRMPSPPQTEPGAGGGGSGAAATADAPAPAECPAGSTTSPARGPTGSTGSGTAAPLGLIALIWLLGLIGLGQSRATWLALLFYGLGSLALAARQWRLGGAASLRLAGGDWRRSLRLGGLIGAALSAVALTALALTPPAAGRTSLLRLLPMPVLVAVLGLLVLVEELLWRGLLPAALTRAGRPGWQVVLLTTLGYAVNHLAAAPLPLSLRWGLVAMAVPIGLANGWLSQASGSLWGGVIAHAMPMLLMVAWAG